MDGIIPGCKYIYKGYSYEVIEIVLLKHPVTRRWKRAVYYKMAGSIQRKRAKYDKPQRFVRLAEDFNNKFKRVE